MDWFRSYHGAPTDPKWLAVARSAKVPPVVVVAVFWSLLDRASQAEDRGSVEGFDADSTACFLGVEETEVLSVLSALEARGIIADGRIAKWEKRQPVRYAGRPSYKSDVYTIFQREVFERDGYACVYCGSRESLSLDHVVPQSRGGEHSPSNLVACCLSCNSSKGAKSLEEWVNR